MKNRELMNIERFEFCSLDTETGDKEFYRDKKRESGFTGLYYGNDSLFFALYPTREGPRIFFEGKEHVVSKELKISLTTNGKSRCFQIPDYGIKINYKESAMLHFDDWSKEIDVDLLYMLWKSYRDDEFYRKYTL